MVDGQVFLGSHVCDLFHVSLVHPNSCTLIYTKVSMPIRHCCLHCGETTKYHDGLTDRLSQGYQKKKLKIDNKKGTALVDRSS